MRMNKPEEERMEHGEMPRHAIQRAGGEDPRRHEAKIIIERKIVDHSQSGYNHMDQPQKSASDRAMMPHSNEGMIDYADGIKR